MEVRTMAGTQTPGPYGSGMNFEPMDAGTLARTRSDDPGMYGKDAPSGTSLFKRIVSGGGGTTRPRRPSPSSNQRDTPLYDYRGNMITVSLSFIIFEPITLNVSDQLYAANEIFTLAGIQFVRRGELVFPRGQSRPFLPDLALPYVAENYLTPRWQYVASLSAVQALPGRIKVFFVRSTSGTDAAYSVGHTLAQRYGYGERIYVSDEAHFDTLAHELGHVLLDHHGDRGGDDHVNDSANLMHGIGRANFTLTREQVHAMRVTAARLA